MLFSIDDDIYIPLKHDYDKVILRFAWSRVYDMVSTYDFTGKDIVLYVSESFDSLFPEQDGRFDAFLHICVKMGDRFSQR